MNWLLLQNSLLVSGGATLAAVALGFVAALWLAGLAVRGRMAVLGLAVLALALPPFLVTNCWLDLLGATGVWRRWLPINIYSLGGTIWILALMLWPITTLAVWGAWQKLEASHLEAEPAMTGGALIRWLLWPTARSALALAAVLTFVLALNNFAVPAILQVKVFPAEVWVQFNTTLDPVAALRWSWPLVVVPAAMLVWFWRREIPWPRVQGPVPPRIFRRQLGGGWLWTCGIVTVALGALSVGLPLVQLGSSQRTWAELLPALSAGQNAVWHSFGFAALAATVVVGIGMLGGVAGQEAERKGQKGCSAPSLLLSTFRFAVWLPFFVPGVLLGIGLIAALNREPFLLFYRSAGIVLLALAIRYLAIGWQGVGRALRATDRDLTDAARLDGATRWQVLRHVQWPQIAPQVAAVWYVVYLLCLWDVESLVLILPPGGETLALRVFNLLHYGHNAQVNALCLLLLALAVGPLVAWGVMRGTSRAIAALGNAEGRRQNAEWKAVGTLVTVGGATLLLCGCGSPSAENEAAVQSRFFSRVEVIGTRGVGPGQFSKPRSVAVDRADNLYVVDMTGRVQKFAPDGRYLLSWQMPQTDLGKAKGMARDGAGNLIVIEPHYQRVNHFTPEGRLVAQWGVSGTNAGQLKFPRAVAVDSRGDMLVSEYGLVERVQRFAWAKAEGRRQKAEPVGRRESSVESARPEVRFLGGFGQAGTGPGEFNRPEGLGVDAQDRIYVADSCNHRVQVFSSDGKLLRAFGRAGSGKGELSYPYDVCVDAAGRVFVCEFGNSRIQVFDGNGEALEIIGGPGAEPGRFANPWGVALDSHGNLYVADALNHRVQRFVRREKAE